MTYGNCIWCKRLSSSGDFMTEFPQVLCRMQTPFLFLVLVQRCQNNKLNFSRPCRWFIFNAWVNEKSYNSVRICRSIERHCEIILQVHHLKIMVARWGPLTQQSMLHKNKKRIHNCGYQQNYWNGNIKLIYY